MDAWPAARSNRESKSRRIKSYRVLTIRNAQQSHLRIDQKFSWLPLTNKMEWSFRTASDHAAQVPSHAGIDGHWDYERSGHAALQHFASYHTSIFRVFRGVFE